MKAPNGPRKFEVKEAPFSHKEKEDRGYARMIKEIMGKDISTDPSSGANLNNRALSPHAKRYHVFDSNAIDPKSPTAVIFTDKGPSDETREVVNIHNSVIAQGGKKSGPSAILAGIRGINKLDPSTKFYHSKRPSAAVSHEAKVAHTRGNAASFNETILGIPLTPNDRKETIKNATKLAEIVTSAPFIEKRKQFAKSFQVHLDNLSKSWFFNRNITWAGNPNSKSVQVKETENKKATPMRDGRVANVKIMAVKPKEVPEEKRKSLQRTVTYLDQMPKGAKDTPTRTYTQMRDGKVAMITFGLKK
jgi:hypothetical protein